MSRTRRLIALALNLLVFALEVVGIVASAREQGWGLLRYYTQDSNIVAMVACGAMAVWQALCLLGRRERVPRWTRVLKYAAACMLAVTLLVVLLVLAPAADYGGYRRMLMGGSMLYLHFLCPVLTLASVCFVEREGEIELRDALAAQLPTLLYAAVAVTLNVLGVLRGPYPFLLVYEQPPYMSAMWAVVILGGAYIIARLIRFLGNLGGDAEPDSPQ